MIQFRVISRAAGLVLILLILCSCVPAVTADNTLTVTGQVIAPTGPVADFSASSTEGTVPLRVQFRDLSTGNPRSWAWDFNNDGIVDSRLKNPLYIYRTAGTYTVKLTVTSRDGSDSETKLNFITVKNTVHPPVARFTQDRYMGRAPLIVKFTDRSLFNPTSYSWTFGDGSTSVEESPTHTFTKNGLYFVRLHASNEGGSDTAYGVVLVLR
jgi:PKD repeat protein